jgi:hypothetical protein
MRYPDHFPVGSARLCLNCEAVTNAEEACPCCTSTRLAEVPRSVINMLLESGSAFEPVEMKR